MCLLLFEDLEKKNLSYLCYWVVKVLSINVCVTPTTPIKNKIIRGEHDAIYCNFCTAVLCTTLHQKKPFE